MNYKIIFCLLFALITSKREFLSFSTTNCKDAESKDQCLNIDNPQTDYQCCYQTIKENDKTNNDCRDYYKDLFGLQDFYSSEKYRAYKKERSGYEKYVLEEETSKQEVIISCKNGNIGYTVNDFEFTEDEQKIIKDKNFCINKLMRKLIAPGYDIGKCEESLLLESTKNVGFECGTLLFTVESEKTLKSTLCNLFNLDFFGSMIVLPLKSELTKNFKEMAEYIVGTNGYVNYTSFNVEYFNQRGQKVKYDSKKDEYEIINIDNNNKGYMLTASKYLFLLLLILF